VLDVWLDEEMRNCRDRTRTDLGCRNEICASAEAIEPGETTVMYARPRHK
jgi:hypothetical protein